MRVRAGSIHLNIEGDVDDARGEAVVLLHGFTENAHMWDAVAAAIRARGFRVVAVDLVGHGASDAPDDAEAYTLDAACDQLDEGLRAIGVKRATVLGYSMGGRVALHLAIRERDTRDLVRALVLVSTSPGIPGPAERVLRRTADGALADRIRAIGVEAFVDEWLQNPVFGHERTRGSGYLESMREARLGNSPIGLARSLEGMGQGTQEYVLPALGGLRIPVLLISGAEDEKFTDLAKHMGAVLPHARHVTLTDCGHAPHRERPDRFLDAALAFLAQHATARADPSRPPSDSNQVTP